MLIETDLLLLTSCALLTFSLVAAFLHTRQLARLNRVSLFFTFGGLSIIILVLTLTTLTNDANPIYQQVIIFCGGILLSSGVLLIVLERRRHLIQWSHSHGLFSISFGLLILTSTVAIPLLVTLLAAQSTDVPADTGQIDNAGSLAIAPTIVASGMTTPTASPTSTTQPTATLFPTNTLRATPTSTWTPIVIATENALQLMPVSSGTAIVNPSGTPGAVVKAQPDCRVTTRVRLNLRAAPTTTAFILTVIPGGTTLAPLATTQDGSWWQVQFNAQTGWLSRDFLQFDTACMTTS